MGDGSASPNGALNTSPAESGGANVGGGWLVTDGTLTRGAAGEGGSQGGGVPPPGLQMSGHHSAVNMLWLTDIVAGLSLMFTSLRTS